MKNIILFLSVSLASGALFINVYNSVVDAYSWGSHIPESMETARKYYAEVNPGTFLRVISPVNQMVALLAVILCWGVSQARKLLIAALIMYVATDALTFGYFYPRIANMFEGIADTSIITQAWKEWAAMNWVRSAIILTGIIFTSWSIHQVYNFNISNTK